MLLSTGIEKIGMQILTKESVGDDFIRQRRSSTRINANWWNIFIWKQPLPTNLFSNLIHPPPPLFLIEVGKNQASLTKKTTQHHIQVKKERREKKYPHALFHSINICDECVTKFVGRAKGLKNNIKEMEIIKNFQHNRRADRCLLWPYINW
jgi:hypothetical protein